MVLAQTGLHCFNHNFFFTFIIIIIISSPYHGRLPSTKLTRENSVVAIVGLLEILLLIGIVVIIRLNLGFLIRIIGMRMRRVSRFLEVITVITSSGIDLFGSFVNMVMIDMEGTTARQ